MSLFQTRVDPIIRPNAVLDPVLDHSWVVDEVDPRVDTMVKLASEGFTFNNDMFPGGCLPSKVFVAPKKQKKNAILKGGRERKATKQGRVPRNPSGIRKPQQTSTDEEETVVFVDMGALSRILDAKFAA